MEDVKQQEASATPAPLVYTPQAPKQQAPPPSEYVLVEDVTGLPAPKRGPQTITVVKYEKDEKTGKDVKKETQLKVPFAPKANCKKCYGRGYIGFKANSIEVIPCLKCYPMNARK